MALLCEARAAWDQIVDCPSIIGACDGGVGRSPFELSRFTFCILEFIILFAFSKTWKFLSLTFSRFKNSRKLICKEHFGFETDLFI